MSEAMFGYYDHSVLHQSKSINSFKLEKKFNKINLTDNKLYILFTSQNSYFNPINLSIIF